MIDFLDGGAPPPPPDECDPGYYYDEGLQRCVPMNSPILIPLTNAQSFKLTSAADGVNFDINGDGFLDRVGWTAADSGLAFLAIDQNGYGTIDSGKELFGNATVAGAKNGFMALIALQRQLNGGQNGRLIAGNPLFERLLLWEDRNHNGVSEPEEIRPAKEIVTEVGMHYNEHNRRDGHGNLFKYRGAIEIRTGVRARATRSRRLSSAHGSAMSTMCSS